MENLIKIGQEDINEFIQLQETIILLENLIQYVKKPEDKEIKITDLIQSQIKAYSSFEEVSLASSKKDLKQMLAEIKNAFDSFEIEKIEKMRLKSILEKAGIEEAEGKDIIQLYENALGVSKNGYKVVHKRDINEIYVNNYSKEWIINWNANMDLQLCLDFYAVITYISDYYSKDDSGTMGHIRDALKKAGNESLQSKLSIVIHTFLTHRQIGESEAFFKIFPHLHMKSSNIDTVFVPTGFKCNRSSFLKQLTEGEAKTCKNVIKIQGKDGCFSEKPSFIDKFERKDVSKNQYLEDLSYTQFCMKYKSSNSEPKAGDLKSVVIYSNQKGFDITEEMELIVTHDFEVSNEHYKLPNIIQLTDIRPGEPKFMRKRSRQVVRFHKFNKTKTPHEYYYAQLQMFLPFKREEDLEPDNFEKCELLYNQKSQYNNSLKIENVRSKLMQYLQSVEEGTERAEEMITSNIGDTIDPALEQENDDCEEIGVIDHPDFLFKDPSDLNMNITEVKKYKAIDLHDEETLDRMSINLDEDQRIVLEIGVDYAKYIVKARKAKEARTAPPLLVVQGGAGTGKSTVIDILSQQMEKILRTPGDNPDHPYIIKAAFTGTAAANIKGQTMHNAFSFSFGNEFFSLGDKARDERRNLLENLRVVIIDEFSMIKSDMLYQLDLRLREIKNQPDLLFGGVSVFLFGDILQLRPVSAYYIFEKPSNETFLLVFLIKSLWKQFAVVVLRHNHRQGKDKQYADILNRVQIGEVTEESFGNKSETTKPSRHSTRCSCRYMQKC